MSKKIYGIPVATPFNPAKIEVDNVVRHDSQDLTEEQKVQARANIGAQPAGDYALNSAIPAKLSNPYALTINGKAYDGSKPVSVTVSGGSGGGAMPDWNAAAGEASHVLNRTHWTETVTDVVAYDTQPLFEGAVEVYAWEEMIAGETYTVEYTGIKILTSEENSVTSVCVGKDEGDGVVSFVGNGFRGCYYPAGISGDYMYGDGRDNRVVIWPTEDLDVDEIEISITGTREVVHKLDPKYLPDGIGGGVSEETIQTIVSEVLSNLTVYNGEYEVVT